MRLCGCHFGPSTVKPYSAQNGNSMHRAGGMPVLTQAGGHTGPCTCTMGRWWPLISSTRENVTQSEIITDGIEAWSGVLATGICGHWGPGRRWCPPHGRKAGNWHVNSAEFWLILALNNMHSPPTCPMLRYPMVNPRMPRRSRAHRRPIVHLSQPPCSLFSILLLSVRLLLRSSTSHPLSDCDPCHPP